MTKSTSCIPAVALAICLAVGFLMGASMVEPAYAAGITISPNSGGFVTEAQGVATMGQNLGDFQGEVETTLTASSGPSSLFGDSDIETVIGQLDDDYDEDNWSSDTDSFVQTVGNITIILLIVFGVLGVSLNLIGGLLLISAWRKARIGLAVAGSILFTISVLISFNLFSLVAAILGWAGVISSSVANRPQDTSRNGDCL